MTSHHRKNGPTKANRAASANREQVERKIAARVDVFAHFIDQPDHASH